MLERLRSHLGWIELEHRIVELARVEPPDAAGAHAARASCALRRRRSGDPRAAEPCCARVPVVHHLLVASEVDDHVHIWKREARLSSVRRANHLGGACGCLLEGEQLLFEGEVGVDREETVARRRQSLR